MVHGAGVFVFNLRSNKMGLFDGIASMVTGAMGGSSGAVAENPMANAMMGILEQHGISGVQGVVSQFEQSGYGAHVASWVGDAQNLPISADQVTQALGNPVVASMAQHFGVDPSQASQMISEHLPGILALLHGNSQLAPGQVAVADVAADPDA
jgi:uncharacterized protein YidB (DUF937 family)